MTELERTCCGVNGRCRNVGYDTIGIARKHLLGYSCHSPTRARRPIDVQQVIGLVVTFSTRVGRVTRVHKVSPTVRPPPPPLFVSRTRIFKHHESSAALKVSTQPSVWNVVVAVASFDRWRSKSSAVDARCCRVNMSGEVRLRAQCTARAHRCAVGSAAGWLLGVCVRACVRAYVSDVCF